MGIGYVYISRYGLYMLWIGYSTFFLLKQSGKSIRINLQPWNLIQGLVLFP